MRSACKLLVVLVFLTVEPTSAQQLRCLPFGNHSCVPGQTFTITAGLSSLPPGSSASNWKIWVNGTAYVGSSLNFVPPVDQDPYEYLYWATVTVTFPGGSQQNLDSRYNGDGRPGDLIAIGNAGLLTSVKWINGFPLHERDWTDGTENGRDIPPNDGPHWAGDSSYPACYQRSLPTQAERKTSGNGNNNVNLRYSLSVGLYWINGAGQFEAQTWPGWGYSLDDQPYVAGAANVHTTPVLPDYILKHIVKLHFHFVAIYSVDGAGRYLGTRTVYTPIYGVFMDPNGMFPPYWRGDIETNPRQRKPWVEILDNAIAHATFDGENKTVTTERQAIDNLTRDLYVWPIRPNGPGIFEYDPEHRRYYAHNQWFWVPPREPLKFDLWNMALSYIGDCQDFAAYLEAQARSLGILGLGKRRIGQSIQTNPILYASRDPFYGTWETPNFGFHQMVDWFYGAPQPIYDWAFGFANPDPFPPWILAVGFTMPQYEGYLTADPTWWSAPFILGGADPFYNTSESILSSRRETPPPGGPPPGEEP